MCKINCELVDPTVSPPKLKQLQNRCYLPARSIGFSEQLQLLFGARSHQLVVVPAHSQQVQTFRVQYSF
jgi:hypothetical protein